MSFERFQRDAMSYAARERVDEWASLDELEHKYWSELGVSARHPLYGADLDGTLFDHNVHPWNLNFLPDMLRTGATALHERMNGINTPMLYFGMYRSTFALHVEDMDLVSGGSPESERRGTAAKCRSAAARCPAKGGAAARRSPSRRFAVPRAATFRPRAKLPTAQHPPAALRSCPPPPPSATILHLARSAHHTRSPRICQLSINYMHGGAPKQWYGAPANTATMIELLAAQCFPEAHARCREFLRHKTALISPETFADNGAHLTCRGNASRTPLAPLPAR